VAGHRRPVGYLFTLSVHSDNHPVRRESNNASPALTSTRPATSTPVPSPPQPHNRTTSDPPEIDLRSLLAQAAAEQKNPENAEDPMIKLMESFMGPISQMGGDPNDPDASTSLQLDPAAITNATGLPPFLVNQFLGGKPPPQSHEQAKKALRWKIVHIVFSFLVGFYVLLSIMKATDIFGSSEEVGLPDQPLPAPATARNPWWIFLAGEVMLQSARRLGGETVSGGYGSFKDIWGVVKDLARDGSIVVFVMGIASLFGVLQV
jgi:GET complex subunit GET2